MARKSRDPRLVFADGSCARAAAGLVKAIGETVHTRVAWGEVPNVGDGLQFRSGRRYLVTAVKGRRLTCLVLPPGTPGLAELEGVYLPAGGRWLSWEWAPRKRR